MTLLPPNSASTTTTAPMGRASSATERCSRCPRAAAAEWRSAPETKSTSGRPARASRFPEHTHGHESHPGPPVAHKQGDGHSGMREPLPDIAFCAEKARLRENFLESVQQLTALHEMQAKAVIAGDSDFSRFDLLIHMANEHKA